MKTKPTKQELITKEEDYIAFLEKALASENFKARVSKEEFEKSKDRLKRARFKLKTLKAK